MNIAVTGANGFLSKNLIFRLRYEKNCKIFKITRKTSKKNLNSALLAADIIFHFAGANKPKKKIFFKKDNIDFTRYICDYLNKSKKPKTIIYSSTIQVNNNTEYGKSKKNSEKQLLKLYKNNLFNVIILRLPNIFGKWSKPNYNSVVSTFCNKISRYKKIDILNPKKKIKLLYIDDLIDLLIKIKNSKNSSSKIISKFKYTNNISVKKLSELIFNFEKNRDKLFIDQSSKFVKNLYSTYISFLPKKKFTYKLKSKTDHRGSFTEILKMKNNGQISVLSSKKNKIRGNHFHHSKIEKFLVLKGNALFNMQNILNKEKISIKLNSSNLKIVETIPGWKHSIKNISKSELIVLIWSNEIFDVSNPDTFQL